MAFANQNLISAIREMNHTLNHMDVLDHAMVTVKVDFESIERSQGIFKCPSELHLGESYQHIINSTTRKWLIDSKPESEEKQRLLGIIDSKLNIEIDLADIRQDSRRSNFEEAEKVLQYNANILAPKLPNIDDLVDIATVISKKVLHDSLLTKYIEQAGAELSQAQPG